jgi:hypothetical protein
MTFRFSEGGQNRWRLSLLCCVATKGFLTAQAVKPALQPIQSVCAPRRVLQRFLKPGGVGVFSFS